MFHIILLLIFYLADIDDTPIPEEEVIFLQLKEIPPHEKKDEILRKDSNEKNFINKKIQKKNIEEDEPIILSDSATVLTKLDTTKKVINIPDSASVIDSFLVNNPDIIALKTVLLKKIKYTEFPESDSLRIVNNFRKQILAYYKFLYPTPLSKFKGSPQGGGMLSIPIDDIINLFK